MMGIRARTLGFSAILSMLPVVALAQPGAAPPTATTPAPPATATPTAPPPGGPPPAGAPPAAPAPSVPPRPATGYAPGDNKPTQPTAPRPVVRRANNIPDAVMPGFEQLPDGSSRLFVRLTKAMPVEEKKATGTITYVIRGTEVPVWNNRNPLVTVHFNTPVSRARLVPSGRDLLFIIELRANVTPTWKMVAEKDQPAVLQIDFAKGEYLPSEPPAPPR